MDETECLTTPLTPDSINQVSEYLNNNYDSGIETSLTKVQKNDVYVVANELTVLIKNLGLEKDIMIDPKKLCDFIGRLLPHEEGMYGGNGDELVPYGEPRPRPNMKNIFYATLAIIISIFLFYIAFIKFDSLVQDITGTNALQAVGDINQEVVSQIRNTLNIPRGDLTLLQFFMRSVQNCGTGITASSISALSILMQNLLKSTTNSLTQKITATCVASPSTGFGTFVDNMASLASSFSSSSSVAGCITAATAFEFEYLLKMITLKLTTTGNVITNLLYTSSTFGTAGILLLSYEVRKMKPLLIRNRPSQLEIENKGGRMKTSKKGNKTKKHLMKKSKKSSKSKKSNKKRKSTRRRGKKYSKKH